MFTSTVHSISHHQGTGTSQTYPKISVLPSAQCPQRSAFLYIRKGSYSCGSRLQYKWYNKYVQKMQNKNVQMIYCYPGGKQYDFKK